MHLGKKEWMNLKNGVGYTGSKGGNGFCFQVG